MVKIEAKFVRMFWDMSHDMLRVLVLAINQLLISNIDKHLLSAK